MIPIPGENPKSSHPSRENILSESKKRQEREGRKRNLHVNKIMTIPCPPTYCGNKNSSRAPLVYKLTMTHSDGPRPKPWLGTFWRSHRPAVHMFLMGTHQAVGGNSFIQTLPVCSSLDLVSPPRKMSYATYSVISLKPKKDYTSCLDLDLTTLQTHLNIF